MEHELSAVFDEFLENMITNKEGAVDFIIKATDDAIWGFGTGRHENIKNKETLLEQMKRDAEQASGVNYRMLSKQVKLVEKIGVCAAEVVLIIPIPEHTIELNTRVTFVFHKQNEGWKAIHGHISFPSPDQAEGESYPIDALKARNKELEKVVEERTAELKRSLKQLETTQAQLIHSEKMASLGELTAGIAHEIQNPLNFINNFSEVNKELLIEINEEIDNGNLEEVKTLAKDVIDNEEKINHHGKRADAIVKGMLQHSRSSNGQKESTDINALADEYLRLAYHGLRAKEKNFNVTLITDYDESISNINIIPQDIGRVILNLITNAFYAVNEKTLQNKASGDTTYEPTVWISTKKSGDQVFISVNDNGNGIPQKAIDKIFQPFFTTKPTGEGTGLGLSISYDIVKAHGGEIKVASVEGKGSEFNISIPSNI